LRKGVREWAKKEGRQKINAVARNVARDEKGGTGLGNSAGEEGGKPTKKKSSRGPRTFYSVQATGGEEGKEVGRGEGTL